jgi:hypothetical protein
MQRPPHGRWSGGQPQAPFWQMPIEQAVPCRDASAAQVPLPAAQLWHSGQLELVQQTPFTQAPLWH